MIALEAARFEVAGVVQGVGFRPFVARLETCESRQMKWMFA